MSDVHDEVPDSSFSGAPGGGEPVLGIEAARIIGCLLEKERTTPADYPMTANSITRACNQSTSRWPVVAYTESEVTRELDALKQAGLIRFVHSQSNRSTKYRHVVDEAWGVDGAELAVLCLLLLRGPQTPGELRTRSERLHPFESPSEVEATLTSLAGRSVPMTLELERGAGQKERRWAQLLTGTPSEDELASLAAGKPSAPRRSDDALVARIDALEAEVAGLRTALEELVGPIGAGTEDNAPDTL